jgi:hypothetical protein
MPRIFNLPITLPITSVNLAIDASATLCNEMIRYSDYNGPQDDVVIRDGHVVPFDRDAAREMAHHAHVLACDVPEQNVSASAPERPVSAAA